jgi:CheY-like chemotaxis protein
MKMAKILLVEDDPDQCREYASFLRSQRGGLHEVDEVESATSAVRMAQDNKYDLVLLDIMMAYQTEDEDNPEINDYEVDYGRKMGLYVYNRIRQLPQPPPIALISVVHDLSTLAEFSGVGSYLPKPFTLGELGTHVHKQLKKPKG